MTDPSEGDLYVSPNGNDDWSGELAAPDDAGTDGPFATVGRARDAIRERREESGSRGDVIVRLRGGTYRIDEPLEFGPADASRVTFAAYGDERPVIDGGRPIEGFEETTVNGVDAWRVEVPAVRDGEWFFRSLFVDGKRRQRARLPSEGFYRVRSPEPVPEEETRALWNTAGQHGREFGIEGCDVEEWHNLADVDAVIPHNWFMEQSPLAAVGPRAGRVRLELYPKAVLEGGERVYLEHVREALSEPGEWYLDRESGELLYVPVDGEEPGEVDAVAPRVRQLVQANGQADDPVERLRFRGVTFRHADWYYPGKLDDDERVPPLEHHPDGSEMVDWGHRYEGAATSIQAEAAVPGALAFEHARHCAVEDCTVEGVGYYGVQFGAGCREDRVTHCELRDLGAGGVKFDGGTVHEPGVRRTGRNRVSDCHVHDGGRVFPEGVGVLARHTYETEITHNHVHDLCYGGISSGWTWGFGPCVERGNCIRKNHVHDVTGDGVENHHTGIYTLGVQPGTVIGGNLIHDIGGTETNGGAIHLDEGSSHMLVEENVVADANQPVNLHYGVLNTILNNVFVRGHNTQVSAVSRLYMDGVDTSALVYRNLLVADGAPCLTGDEGVTSNNNLFWNEAGKVTFTGDKSHEGVMSIAEWRASGNDRDSVVADPEIERLDGGGIRLAEGSPAFEVGFEPIDCSDVGPRPRDDGGSPR